MAVLRELKPGTRWALALLSLAIVGIAIVAGLPAIRQSVLRAAGQALVAEDPPFNADIIVISTDAMDAGILEAADLVHAGFAKRVAIFARPVSRASLEFVRRGVQPLDLETVSLQLLHELGVTEIAVIPPVAGTVDEGNVLRQWCATSSIHSILFVSAPDHSRRTRRVLDRALARHGVEVGVRIARFAEFDPDSWWQTRGGQRIEAVESEKLLLDVLAHPF